jgi:DNA-binding CsgD family transcriptional regulator
MADRIELQPLSADDVAQLLAAALEGEVEARTGRRLWTVSGGNPLYLKEVTLAATEAGTLRLRDGMWCWRGEIQVGSRLRELVGLRLAGLDAGQRAVVELLAVGEPLLQSLVSSICEPAAVAALERRGVVRARPTAAGVQLSLDHPLFSEVVRSAIPAADWARVCRLLLENEHTDTSDDFGLLRVATWQMESGGVIDAGLLTRAAARANALFDSALAERLARAAIDAGAGPEAMLALGDALYRLGRYKDVVGIVEPLVETELADDLRVHVATLLADAGYWGLGRTAETEASLRRIEALVVERRASERLRALVSSQINAAGRIVAGGELALSLAEDESADPIARLRASTAAAMWLSFRGDADAAVALCDALLPVGFLCASELPRGLGWVVAQRILALTCLGRFDEAEQMLAPVRAMALAEGDDEVIGASSLVLGRLALSRGDLPNAAAMLRQAAASLRNYDPTGYLPWCLAVTAQAAAQMGDAAGAKVAVEEAHLIRSPVTEVYAFELVAGRAWAAAASGEISAAVEAFGAGAEKEQDRGNRFGASLLVHEALRCGGAPSEMLARLGGIHERDDIPVHRSFVAHATALATDDPAALERVAGEFEALGALLLAAEAAAEASAAYRRRSLVSAAARAAGRATRLASSCGEPRTPALLQGTPASDLTLREREVSRLAMAGYTNAEIAGRLSLRVRTVEGHLLRAMTKLGVHDRRDLAAALNSLD